MVTNRQLPAVTADAIKAVEAQNKPPSLFHLAGTVVRLRHDKGTYTEAMDRDALTGHLARVATWVRRDAKGNVLNTVPSKDVVNDLLSLPSWTLPVLDGIITAPIFAESGKLLDRPGYDAASRLWYQPGPGLEDIQIPDRPTPEQIRESVRLLWEDLLGDFPFKTPSDKANCLALFVLPGVRAMIAGKTPMHVLEANKQGTGKSLLGELWGRVWLGTDPSYNKEAHSEKEWGEMIGSALMKSPNYFFLDNVKYPLKSAALAVALTTGLFQYRILGQSKVVDLPVKWTWIATGNNIKGDGDIARRLVRCRLDANCERPELRTDFRIKDVASWARQNRSALVSACLTLSRAWIVAGKPRGNYTLGSYPEYAETIGGILDVAGVAGFLGNLADNHEVNTVDAEWRGLVNAWALACGESDVTTGQLFDLACEFSILQGIMGSGTEQGQRVKLGNALAKRVGQVYSGWKITTVKDETGKPKYARKGGILYRLIPVPVRDKTTDKSPSDTKAPETITTSPEMTIQTTASAVSVPTTVEIATTPDTESSIGTAVAMATASELMPGDVELAEATLADTDPIAVNRFLTMLATRPKNMAVWRSQGPLAERDEETVKWAIDCARAEQRRYAREQELRSGPSLSPEEVDAFCASMVRAASGR
jgi:hypothetical protein